MVETRSSWTPVALGIDVPRATTRALLLDGRELVAWRSDTGAVQVWLDLCPHRGMRLSFGFVRGERLACLYHGWEYGAAGSCQRIPAHPDLSVPPSIRATTLRAVEAGGLIWMTEAPDLLPPSLPDLLPVATLALAAPESALAEALGVNGDERFAPTALGGLPLQLGWHPAGSGETMLHAVAAPGVDARAALAALRQFRTSLESRVAA